MKCIAFAMCLCAAAACQTASASMMYEFSGTVYSQWSNTSATPAFGIGTPFHGTITLNTDVAPDAGSTYHDVVQAATLTIGSTPIPLAGLSDRNLYVYLFSAPPDELESNLCFTTDEGNASWKSGIVFDCYIHPTPSSVTQADLADGKFFAESPFLYFTATDGTYFLSTPTTFTAVPEPATLSLLAFAAPLALRRRR